MGRSPCCAKEGLNRGAWTATEDRILTEYIKVHGEGKWRNLPKKAGLKRCGKSCRLRWLNYLRPDIKRGNITHDEEELIIRLHKLLGNRWSLIAGRLPGRTDNEIKNYWNSNIGKKIMQGHPISTPNHKTNPRSPPPPPPPPPLVHHTKPSRCTKVLFPSTEPAPVKHQVIETPSIVQDLANPSENDGNPSDNFFPEFEMDVNFISEFLNSDNFSQLCDFHSGVEADSINTSNTISSTTHDQYYSSPLLINEETLQNPNLFSIDSFLDSEMDWFF